MKNKSVWLWAALLVIPYPILVFNLFVSAVGSSLATNSTARILTNIMLIITGIISVIIIILSPLWMILMILGLVHNQKK